MTDTDQWWGLVAHEVSIDVRRALEARDIDTGDKVATLSPLFVADANLPIYRELSTGPFLYRIGDLLSREQRKRFVGTSPSSIGNILKNDAPSAILVGFEYDLDSPLIEYARRNGYRKVNGCWEKVGGTLYVRQP
jgi:hypothetical protein